MRTVPLLVLLQIYRIWRLQPLFSQTAGGALTHFHLTPYQSCTGSFLFETCRCVSRHWLILLLFLVTRLFAPLHLACMQCSFSDLPTGTPPFPPITPQPANKSLPEQEMNIVFLFFKTVILLCALNCPLVCLSVCLSLLSLLISLFL